MINIFVYYISLTCQYIFQHWPWWLSNRLFLFLPSTYPRHYDFRNHLFRLRIVFIVVLAIFIYLFKVKLSSERSHIKVFEESGVYLWLLESELCCVCYAQMNNISKFTDFGLVFNLESFWPRWSLICLLYNTNYAEHFKKITGSKFFIQNYELF